VLLTVVAYITYTKDRETLLLNIQFATSTSESWPAWSALGMARSSDAAQLILFLADKERVHLRRRRQEAGHLRPLVVELSLLVVDLHPLAKPHHHAPDLEVDPPHAPARVHTLVARSTAAITTITMVSSRQPPAF
jgi:hypothetical protein